ncbi:MAG: hypothetical protein NUV56_03620 [Candidatus Uhrbacteria bacterium]|nr:hypothetical protein [Candidatus Uhrbacteria bacterium]
MFYVVALFGLLFLALAGMALYSLFDRFVPSTRRSNTFVSLVAEAEQIGGAKSDVAVGLYERMLVLAQDEKDPLDEQRRIARMLMSQYMSQLLRVLKHSSHDQLNARRRTLMCVKYLCRHPDYQLGTNDWRSILCLHEALCHLDDLRFDWAIAAVAATPDEGMRTENFAFIANNVVVQYFTNLDVIAGTSMHEAYRRLVFERLMPMLAIDVGALIDVVGHNGASVAIMLKEIGASEEEVRICARTWFDRQFGFYSMISVGMAEFAEMVMPSPRIMDPFISLRIFRDKLGLPFVEETRKLFAKLVEHRNWPKAYALLTAYPDDLDAGSLEAIYRGCGEDTLTGGPHRALHEMLDQLE